MVKISSGVYRLSLTDIGSMPCLPRDIDLIQGALKDIIGDEVASLIIKPSKPGNAWCGVTWAEIKRGIPKMEHDDCHFYRDELWIIRQEIQTMVCDGLLVRKGWWPRVICPTPKLVETILAYQEQQRKQEA